VHPSPVLLARSGLKPRSGIEQIRGYSGAAVFDHLFHAQVLPFSITIYTRSASTTAIALEVMKRSDHAEAAAMLRRVLDALEADELTVGTTHALALLRRMEGAAATFEVIANNGRVPT